MSSDQELIQEYGDALGFLVGWLDNYTGVRPTQRRKYERHIENLRRCSVSGSERLDSFRLSSTLQSVDYELCDVYFGWASYEWLDLDPEDMGETLRKEADRLRRVLPGLGYKVIYDHFDEGMPYAWMDGHESFEERLGSLVAFLSDDAYEWSKILSRHTGLLPAILAFVQDDSIENAEDMSEKIGDFFSSRKLNINNPYNFRDDPASWYQIEYARIDRLYMELNERWRKYRDRRLVAKF